MLSALGRFNPFGHLRAIAGRLRHGGNAVSMAQVVAFRSLAMGVNIATSLLTAAVLGPSGRGEQAALVLAPTFLGGLASLGLHGSLIYNLKADPAHERELLGNGILLTLFAGCLAVLCGWIIEPYWLRQYSDHTVLVGRLLLLVTPLIVIAWSLSGAAESRGWFTLANGALYLQSLATLLILGVLALLDQLTPTTSALAYMLPIIPMFLYIFIRIVRRMRPIFRLRRDLVGRLLHYGAKLCGVDILGTLSGYLDQLIIVAFLAPKMVGTYAVALSSARMLNVVQAGVSSVLFPSIAGRSSDAIVPTVAKTFRITMVLLAGLAVLLALIGPALLRLAYGAAFADSIMPFRVLLLAMVLENGARILYQIYSGSGRPELVTFFECAATTLACVAMAALVPFFDTFGAALAVLCGSVFRMATGIAGLPLLLKQPIPRLILGRADLHLVWPLRDEAAAPVCLNDRQGA